MKKSLGTNLGKVFTLRYGVTLTYANINEYVISINGTPSETISKTRDAWARARQISKSLKPAKVEKPVTEKKVRKSKKVAEVVPAQTAEFYDASAKEKIELEVESKKIAVNGARFANGRRDGRLLTVRISADAYDKLNVPEIN